jgi:hypothetical protein
MSSVRYGVINRSREKICLPIFDFLAVFFGFLSRKGKTNLRAQTWYTLFLEY